MSNAYSHKWKYKYEQSVQRKLADCALLTDFASNDYLGFSRNERVKKIIEENYHQLKLKGSTGSRLISGNRNWIEEIEKKIAHYHHSENALIFPSAYQANVGLFSCIADRNDLYITDENIHASIYDGIRLSFAKHFKFKHNDFDDLKKLIDKFYSSFENIFVVVEGLYSMDGNTPDIEKLLALIDNKKVFLIADEAHSFGIMGDNNLGLCNSENIAENCVARIIGYGKSAGFSGAAVVGSEMLKKYLINFSRAFIFSTALPFYHYQIIDKLYDEIIFHSDTERHQLYQNIELYLNLTKGLKNFSHNFSPVQYMLLEEQNFQSIQNKIIENNIYAKVILPPTVSKGQERIRISLHSFNTADEIKLLIKTLKELNHES